MKASDIRDLDDKTIHEEIDRLEKELMDLRMGAAIGSIENPMRIRSVRKDIARMKTVQTEKRKTQETETKA